jgi:hypothetical protein
MAFKLIETAQERCAPSTYPTSSRSSARGQLQTKFDKERGSSLEVVDNNANVVHPLDRHVLKHGDPDGSKLWRLLRG